ncbi:MAG: SipW-dependent-type signal peptide-containing protein [Oscillospiraceae bacterium]|nr:SipW-dependent-type signal peptide-containing protein [Oscillospiraceae bacterium]
MKLNKKKILVLALALSLLALISAGTLAWFTDSDSVTNNFHVATSTQEPDDIFSVTLLENVDTNGDGIADKAETGYIYEDIYPGAQLVKEPFVTNTGSYDQYIRVLVTIDADYDALVGDLTGTYLGYDDTLWTAAGKTVSGNKVTYTYYLNAILAPNASQTLFTHVEIPANLKQTDFATISAGDFQMIIEAQAVQADNTGDNAQQAFALVG